MSNTKLEYSIGYIKGLDILRFIAAAGVIFHHIGYRLAEKGVRTPFYSFQLSSGEYFLDLFFVISGFLITSILFKEIDTKKFNIKNFFIRRILRIWPLYFFVIILSVIIIPLATNKGSVGDILYNTFFASLFITNIQAIFFTLSKSTYLILWSVGIEEQIYLLFPFILLFFKKKRLLMILALTVIGLLSWMYLPFIMKSANGYNPAYFFTTSYFYYFGFGGLITFFLPKNNSPNKADAVLLNPLFQFFVCLFCFYFVFHETNTPKQHPYFYLALNGSFSAYLIYCAARGKLFFDFLSSKTSKLLGSISYGMYLLHIQVLGLGMLITKKMSTPSHFLKYDIVLTVFVLLFTIGLSIVLHKLIEKPFLKLKSKYTSITNK